MLRGCMEMMSVKYGDGWRRASWVMQSLRLWIYKEGIDDGINKSQVGV